MSESVALDWVGSFGMEVLELGSLHVKHSLNLPSVLSTFHPLHVAQAEGTLFP